MADINERLDRLQRREEFDRLGRPRRAAPTEEPVGPVAARPAGVDDRLGEVLDAVAAVVRRHRGLSVMVALADGRAGRPVIRVTERDGGVETGVVVVGSTGPAAVAPEPAAQVAAVPTASSPPGAGSDAEALTRDFGGEGPVREFGPELVAPEASREPAARVLGREPVAAEFGGEPAGPELGPEPAAPEFGGEPGAPEVGREAAAQVLGRESVARDLGPEVATREIGGEPGYGAGALETAAADYGPYDGLSTRAAAPARESVPGSDPVFEPSFRDEASFRDGLPSRPAVRGRASAPIGRHAAGGDEPGAGWSGSSWHNALWSPESRDRFRQADRDRSRATATGDSARREDRTKDGPRWEDQAKNRPHREDRAGDRPSWEDRAKDRPRREDRAEDRPGREAQDLPRRQATDLPRREAEDLPRRQAKDLPRREARAKDGPAWDDRTERDDRTPGGPGSAIPLPEDTSQIVSRLAQLLRENPTLATNWSREAQE